MSSFTNTSPVLFIARAFPNITERRIRDVMDSLNLGQVERVDIKPWKNKEGKSFNKLFIHLNWNTDSETQTYIDRLNSGKEIKIVYDDPWFWKVSAYKNNHFEGGGGAPRRRMRTKIEIPDDLITTRIKEEPNLPPPRDIEEGSGGEQSTGEQSADKPGKEQTFDVYCYGGNKAIPNRKKKLSIQNPDTLNK
jgi:hypothetical protein